MKSRLDDQRTEFPPFVRKFEPNSVNFSLDSPVLCNGNTLIDNKSKIEIMHQRLSKEIMKYEKAKWENYIDTLENAKLWINKTNLPLNEICLSSKENDLSNQLNDDNQVDNSMSLDKFPDLESEEAYLNNRLKELENEMKSELEHLKQIQQIKSDSFTANSNYQLHCCR
ncbi:unnamed protein product [Schistosoma mattheei]|uniref:Uncharacterized protein n=1 Tax=Schistosoma mattheei TaxID=31246 RepID=A0A183PUK9_9TREM|nr:unnamed protein product [Schistosoma mattheei]